MSEASLEIPLVLEKIKPECGDVTSNTSSKIDPPNSGLKILSRYLRASTGSCHDICKYGIEVIPERAGSGPLPKLITSMGTEGQNLEIAVSAVRKLKFGLSAKPFPDCETQKPENSDVGKTKVSLSTNKEIVCPKTMPSAPEGIDVSVELKHNQSRESSLPRQSSNDQRNEIKKNSKGANDFKSKEMRKSLSGQRKALVTPAVSLPPKHSLRRISSMPTLTPKNLRRVSLISKKRIKSEPEDLDDEDVPEKSLYKIVPVAENRTTFGPVEPPENHVRVSNLSSSSCLPSENKYPKHVKKKTSTTGLLSSPDKNMRTTRSGTHVLHSPLSSQSPRKKELNGTHRKQLSLSSLSLLSSSSSSSVIQSGNKHNKENHSASENDYKENENQKVNLKAEPKRRARRAGIVGLENKSSPVKKLKFRKGKVVDLQPEDSNLRSLKFTPTVSLSPKHSLRRISSMPILSPKNLKRPSLPRQEKIKTAEPEDLDDEDVPEESLYKIGPVAENRTLEPTQNHVHVTSLSSSLYLPSDRKYRKRVQKRTSTTGSPSSSEKNLRTTRSGTHAIQSPLSSQSSRKKELGHTRNGTHGKRLSLSSLSLLSSSITQSGNKQKENRSASDNDAKEIEKKKVNLKAEQKSRFHRAGLVGLENKSNPVKKLKVRKGKVVDFQPKDSNLRRLKLKQAKLLPEIQIDNTGLKKASYKRNEVDDSGLNDAKSVEGNGKRSFRRSKVIEELFGTRINSKKVVLKQQNVVRKNNSQSLINNVIEETASRLVQSRKSKVKALVGAFETVISLQDTTPSAMAGAS